MVFTVMCAETKEESSWTLAEVLEEINRDRNPDWIPYDESDWVEGWNEFVEGEFYKLLSVKKEEK